MTTNYDCVALEVVHVGCGPKAVSSVSLPSCYVSIVCVLQRLRCVTFLRTLRQTTWSPTHPASGYWWQH